ncbi:MAG: hypothetical protein N2439_03875 [Anaerolineae bacterium]|nr:hypothetical protein [Anaerolineae bacterium]
MSPEIGLAATRIALFLIVAAGLMLLAVAPNSAEFVVLILTIGVGAVMLLMVGILARLGISPRTRSPEADDASEHNEV